MQIRVVISLKKPYYYRELYEAQVTLESVEIDSTLFFFFSEVPVSKKQDAIYNSLLAAIANMNKPPPENKAQNYLTDQAVAGAEFLKKGEFNQMPKGMFFNFDTPVQQLDTYKKLSNVNQGGTFALANGGADVGGRSNATQLQGKYLTDKFARDASQNYQNNITNAAGNIQGALNQASNAQFGANGQLMSNNANVASAYGNLLGSNYLNKPSIWSSVLGAVGQIGSSAIAAGGF